MFLNDSKRYNFAPIYNETHYRHRKFENKIVRL